MSTDVALQLNVVPISQKGTSGSLFSLEASDTEEPDWLKAVLDTESVQEVESSQEEPWVYVAPHFYVRKSEYKRRFGEFDLDYYRQRMTPELFTAFVRHMGVVPGSPELDVVELTALPDL